MDCHLIFMYIIIQKHFSNLDLSLSQSSNDMQRVKDIWNAMSFNAVVRVIQKAFYVSKPQSFKELSKHSSLDEIDPKLIRKLINQRTDELNAHRNFQKLKRRSDELKVFQEVKFSKYSKRLWTVVFAGAIGVLITNFVNWKEEYKKRESELNAQVVRLDSELNGLLQASKDFVEKPSIRYEKPKKENQEKQWYEGWFWVS